jgi:hypothetical protein
VVLVPAKASKDFFSQWKLRPDLQQHIAGVLVDDTGEKYLMLAKMGAYLGHLQCTLLCLYEDLGVFSAWSDMCWPFVLTICYTKASCATGRSATA